MEATSSAGASVTLNASASSDPDGDPLTFTWTGPFGTLTGATITPTLPLGTHAITLTADDGNGGMASDTVSVTVRDTTAPVVTPPADITVTATEAGGARGSASTALAAFLAGGSATDSADPNPTRLTPQFASMNADNNTLFPLGSSTVTFRFTDASGNLGSATATVTVVAPDFALSVAPSSITLSSGASATVVIIVTPQPPAPFMGQVSFACSNLPLQAACGFSPAAVVPGSNPVTARLTISTNGAMSLGAPRVDLPGAQPFLIWLLVLAVVVLPLYARARDGFERRRLGFALGVVLVLAISATQTACGGGLGGTPPGRYQFAVLASAGSTQHSITVTLNVQ